LVDVDLLSNFSNQILVERRAFAFIVDVEYEKLSLFCSNCKMIDHLSNCKWLQQNANLISGGKKTIGEKYNNIIVQRWLVYKMRLRDL